MSLYICFKMMKSQPITKPQRKQRVFKKRGGGLQPSALRNLVLTYRGISFEGTFPKTGVSLKGRVQSSQV